MKILISNDDGIFARGLEILEEVCRDVGRVTVVAPDREQSAASNSLTISRPLRVVDRGGGRFQVDGTPTDCVLLALDTIMSEPPSFVISGINHGTNMGEDVLYSGTVAAAMEGLSLGIPGMAISSAGGDPDIIDSQRDWIRRLVANVVTVEDFPKETLLNVNLPNVPGTDVKGIQVTKLGRRFYSESLRKMKDPWGQDIYWIGAGKGNWSGGDDSDFRAVADGYISVTPLHVDLTRYDSLELVRSWNLDA